MAPFPLHFVESGRASPPPRQLGLETVSRRIFSVLVLRSDVLVLRRMFWCRCRFWSNCFNYFLFLQLQSIRPEVVVHSTLRFSWSFLPARRYASAGLCDSDVSVRPSVCLSVCPYVCHTPVLCLAERKQDHEMYTI